MRDGATVVNTARPALVDQDALVDELLSGRLNAVLDLTVPERLPHDSPLFGLPNVLVTPQLAGSMGVELTRLGDAAVDEVRTHRGRPPPAAPGRRPAPGAQRLIESRTRADTFGAGPH